MKKEVELDANGYRKFGLRDKLAYAAGDFGCNMSFALKGTMQVFWTQYMGISLEVFAVLMLVVQVWDGINDPIIGAMVDADKRKYKRNKFLQYIWVGSIGLIVAGAACFIPFKGAPMVLKYALYVLGYMLWDAFYTVANVPYGSLLSLISKEAGDRAELSTFRSLGSGLGGILAGVLVPILIYDSTNNLKGDKICLVALVMGMIGFACFQFMIRNTVIRVETEPVQQDKREKFDVRKVFTNFFRNRAAVGATLAAVGTFLGQYGATYSSTVMWQSYFQNAKISGLMTVVSYLPVYFFMPFVRKIVVKWGKKESITVGTTIALVGYGLMFIFPITPDVNGMILWVIANLIAGLGNSVYQCVMWSLMADAMDYGEWKFGVREEGTVYAIHSFFRKLSQGVGPSIGLFVAAALGYVESAGANQTFEVATKMFYQTAVFYFVGQAIKVIGLVVIYNLDTKKLEQIQADLEVRRKSQTQVSQEL